MPLCRRRSLRPGGTGPKGAVLNPRDELKKLFAKTPSAPLGQGGLSPLTVLTGHLHNLPRSLSSLLEASA
jgi:hypothetical protein